MIKPEELIIHTKYLVDTISLFKNKDKTQINILSSVSNYNINLTLPQINILEQIYKNFMTNSDTFITFIEETNIVVDDKNIYKVFAFVYNQEDNNIEELEANEISELFMNKKIDKNYRFYELNNKR
jgi:hypothetical protein